MPEVRYAMNELVRFFGQLLERKGLSKDRAMRLAEHQIAVQAFGIPTHGIPVLLTLAESLGKTTFPDRHPRIIRDCGAVSTMDCGGCIGVEALLVGCERAKAKADSNGIGMVSLLNCSWVGVLGYHLSPLARKGYIAIATAQLSTWPCVAPYGGCEPRLSANPIAFSVPAVPDPVVSDFSTAAISRKKAKQWDSSGTSPTESIFMDKSGNATSDSGVLADGGTILPFGGMTFGFRGTALAMLSEIMTAAVGGEPSNLERMGGQNVHILVLNVHDLGGPNAFSAMSRFLSYMLSSRPARDCSGPRLPGQRGWTALAEAKETGISLEAAVQATLRECAHRFTIPFPKNIACEHQAQPRCAAGSEPACDALADTKKTTSGGAE